MNKLNEKAVVKNQGYVARIKGDKEDKPDRKNHPVIKNI